MAFKRKQSIAVAGLLVAIGGAVSGVVYVLSQPAVGTKAVRGTLEKAKPTLPTQPATSAAPIDNEYFMLELPSGFALQASQGASGRNLMTTSLTKTSLSGTLLTTINVAPIPEGGVVEDSNYRLRQSQSNRYRFTTVQREGQTIPVAVDTEAGGAVAFYSHGGNYATISMSIGLSNPSQSDQDTVVAALTQLLDGWQWKS